MAGLKQIKTKIRSVNKTGKVTKAMESVSAAKMRKAQDRAFVARPYARAAAEILARVSHSRTLQNHPLTRLPAGGSVRTLYIVITSDKGLAGGLNSGVLRAVSADMKKTGEGSVRVIAVGRKAHDFFTHRSIEVEAFHENTELLSSELIREITNEATMRFALKECDVVKICYQNFISTFEQRPTIRQIFPLSLAELSQVVEDIRPKEGKFSTEGGAHESVADTASYTVEPSEEEVLDSILPQLASIFVYHALLESQASEHSARMVAMKGATDKARDLSKELTLKFNKARQAAITREVSEIIGGIEAMAA